MGRSFVIFLVFVFSNYPLSVRAQILAQCGKIPGHAYYLPIGNKEGEWIRDRAKNSNFSLSLKGKEADILWKDRTGLRSASSDGGKVYAQGFSDGVVTLYVNYEKTSLSEIWTFNLTKKEMYYSSHRIVGLAPKVALYKASCK